MAEVKVSLISSVLRGSAGYITAFPHAAGMRLGFTATVKPKTIATC
jgi:hypothetical protein